MEINFRSIKHYVGPLALGQWGALSLNYPHYITHYSIRDLFYTDDLLLSVQNGPLKPSAHAIGHFPVTESHVTDWQ